MTRPVFIVAHAARTCVGLSGEATASAVRAGVSRVMAHPFFIDGSGQPLMCGRDPQIDPEQLGFQRLESLATRTLDTLLAKASLRSPVMVRLALPEPRPGFTADDAAQLGLILSANRDVHARCQPDGHGGALRALKEAYDEVDQARAEIAIAGGVDSYLDADTLAWLDDEKRILRDGIRAGFSPGEGSAMLMLASAAAVRRLQLRPLARVRNAHLAHEARDLNSETGSLGEGLSQAVVEATRNLRLPDELITDLYADINGETHRTEDWGFTVLRAPNAFRDASHYVNPGTQCGELGAATAALGCILATHAWQRRYAKGPRAMVWAGSWSGLRGATVLESMEAEP